MEVDHPSGDSDQKGAVMGDLLKEIQIKSPKAADALKRAVMGDLLKEIHIKSPKAADVLKQASLESDSYIQSLTREDLNELLPGAGDFKLRKNVFQMIQKSRPANMLQKELGELPNNLAICAVMGDLLKEIQTMSPEAADFLKQAGLETDSDIQSLTREDLNELLPGAGDFKLRKNVFEMIQKSSQLKSLEILPNDNVDPLTNNNTRQLDSKAEKGAVMGDLLKEIQIKSPKAADVLKQAGLESDSDIQSLTREDLNELLPGAGDFKLRKNVFQMIQKSSQLKSLEILPNDNVDLLKNNNTRQLDPKAEKGAVMGDLLKEIQNMSTKAADVLKQAGFETNSDIHSLNREDLNELLPGAGDLRLRKNVFEMIQKLSQLTSSEDLPNDNKDTLKNNNTGQLDPKAEKETRGRHQQGAQGDSNARTSPHYFQEVTVKCKMVVRGKTFGAHTQLMDQVKRTTKGNVRLLENSQDSKIIIVFCPITSRIESDVKAAMTGVPGDKPIILVKMHHVCESKSSLCFNTSIDDRNDVVQVNVFYHESLCGLLECELNENAVDEIQQELLKHSDHRSKGTSPSTSGQVPENQAKKDIKKEVMDIFGKGKNLFHKQTK